MRTQGVLLVAVAAAVAFFDVHVPGNVVLSLILMLIQLWLFERCLLFSTRAKIKEDIFLFVFSRAEEACCFN